jgi:hypothetical protein
MIRFALVHLLLGFTAGAVLLAAKGVGGTPTLWALRPLHVEWLLVGWTAQLTMGVAYWIFPRVALRRDVTGSAGPVWFTFIALNAGVWLAGLGAMEPRALDGAVALGGRLLEAGAAAAFVTAMWRRVRPGLAQM